VTFAADVVFPDGTVSLACGVDVSRGTTASALRARARRTAGARVLVGDDGAADAALRTTYVAVHVVDAAHGAPAAVRADFVADRLHAVVVTLAWQAPPVVDLGAAVARADAIADAQAAWLAASLGLPDGEDAHGCTWRFPWGTVWSGVAARDLTAFVAIASATSRRQS
jgi:hypothetical protein